MSFCTRLQSRKKHPFRGSRIGQPRMNFGQRERTRRYLRFSESLRYICGLMPTWRLNMVLKAFGELKPSS